MVAPLIRAAKAYAAAQGIAGAEIAGGAAAATGPNFGQMVTQAINQVATDSKTAETQITANMQGKANLVDVVTALSSAQTSLNAMICGAQPDAPVVPADHEHGDLRRPPTASSDAPGPRGAGRHSGAIDGHIRGVPPILYSCPCQPDGYRATAGERAPLAAAPAPA